MSINTQHLPQPPNLRNKKNKIRRKRRHQYKINQTKQQKKNKLNNRLNHNKYNTWDSETIKPVIDSNITKQYYLYYKVLEELKEQQLNKVKLISYIDDTYEHIKPDEIEDDLNKNTCLIC